MPPQGSRPPDRPYLSKIKTDIHGRPEAQPLLEMMAEEKNNYITRVAFQRHYIDHSRESEDGEMRLNYDSPLPDRLIDQHDPFNPPSSFLQVFVIENISPQCIEQLGHSWNLDVEFFVQHAMDLHPRDLRLSKYNTQGDKHRQRWHHLNAYYEFQRQLSAENFFSGYFKRKYWFASDKILRFGTRISYYYVHSGLCKISE